jgi:hypothetical protein
MENSRVVLQVVVWTLSRLTSTVYIQETNMFPLISYGTAKGSLSSVENRVYFNKFQRISDSLNRAFVRT